MHLISLFLLATSLLVLTGCQNADRVTNSDTASSVLQLVTTTYPLQEFAQLVGGEHATVKNLTAGIEPHEFEPTPQTVQIVSSADLLIMNGAGIDSWANDLAVEARTLMIMARSITPSKSEKNPNPHFWMDPVLAQEMVSLIRDQLIALDAEHADDYTTNAEAAVDELKKLDQEFQTGLADCERRDIIVAHDAFGYLASRYSITAHAIAGISPEEEPSPQKIAELSELAHTTGITHIFFESMTSPKLAETVAMEADAQTLVLNPIEGFTAKERAQGNNYFTAMRENLKNLRTALACQ